MSNPGCLDEHAYKMLKCRIDNELRKFLESIEENKHYHLLSAGAESFHIRVISIIQSEFYLSTESGDKS